ncbi:MAG: germination protein YpeB [Clostridia bacterium]|nr:germination protein YpeB [Clostridia bacterium]MBQ4158071.1 germination protein YpeB [Clostridia bacterium]
MKEKAFKITFALIAVVAVALGILYGKTAGMERRERTEIINGYKRAFYETSELIHAMQVNLKKLTVTGSAETEKELLFEIARQAEGAQSNLSSLPSYDETIVSTMKFVNQTGDFSKSLAQKLINGGAVSEEDRNNINILLENISNLALAMDEAAAAFEEGRLKFSKQKTSGEDTDDQPIEPVKKYPSLLYDGPFSDGQTDEINRIPGVEINGKDAERALERSVDIPYKSILMDENENVYDFTIETDIGSMYAGVSKKGGHVLYLISSGGNQKEILTAEECISYAKKYLNARGFPEMTESYYRKFAGVITVNLAPVQNDVILYPDLVKVNVSMESGKIIGFEMTGYYVNHREREFIEPIISEDEAALRISDNLTVKAIKKALIPDGKQEKLCYEILAQNNGDEFLVYIDCETGEEREIFQVVDTQEGTLVE